MSALNKVWAAPKLPPLYTYRAGKFDGPRACNADGHCVRCGKPLVCDSVQLELDQEIGEYHDFGAVPPALSQGWFDFGPSCANALRKRAYSARAALARAEGKP